MTSSPRLNIIDTVIDEIALEGLDGITLEALWQRLSRRLHDPMPLPKAFVEQVWSICSSVKGIEYYQLERPREKLVIFDRYEFIDPDLGTIWEPDNVPDDIYPHCPIEDSAAGIKGSCSTYRTRKNITAAVKALTLEEARETYGQSLVLVASQYLRNDALLGDGVCPTLELTILHYCFLERVGRARYHGEVTQGKNSLSLLKEDPKSLFYHRKFLLSHKLITKQIHHQKAAGHSCSGSLLHLPRFYVERKPKIIYLAEQVIEILKSKVNCVAEYDEIKKELQIENSIKKLFRMAFFLRVVKTDLRVPYRTLYPDAEEKEWQQKQNPNKEKTIRVVQLLDPDIDVSELWGKDDMNDDDEPYELDISEQKYNVLILKQANRLVEETGQAGICQSELAKKLGQTKLQARMIVRTLVRLQIVAPYMHDLGRQRVTKFVSKKFEKSSALSKQFEQEMDKIKELTKNIDDKLPKVWLPVVTEKGREVASSSSNKTPIETVNPLVVADPRTSSTAIAKSEVVADLDDKSASLPPSIPAPFVDPAELARKLRLKFSAVNDVLRKYKGTKLCGRYRPTFPNIGESKGSEASSSSTPEEEEVGNDESMTTETIRTTEQILEEQSKILPNLKSVDRDKAITLYDSIETKLVEQQPMRLGKPSNKVVGFMEDLHINEKKQTSSITYRLLKRANMIIESVKEHKVIDDLSKLMKMINEEEEREGYDVKIDKKSLIRLLQKLAKDNVVKNIKLTLRAGGREKALTFICHPSIGAEHSVIQSAVEQAKIKFCLMGSQKMKAIIQNQYGNDKNEDSVDRIDVNKGLEAYSPSKKSKLSASTFKYDFKIGKRYGYSPKFIRMQTLHIFLFYLIYDHPGEPKPSNEEQIAKLRESGNSIDDELASEMSTIYNLEIGWKMFIPPLTCHQGWPHGWTMMCDVLLRMPLSIFIKIHNVCFVVPELESYLNHPIRKHYLVKNLPSRIRNTLLIARKYIFNVHECVTRLCYIGLIQFGPQKLKDKDQVFLYLNKRTRLTDTTSSAAGYHKVEDKEYPRISYVFDSLQAAEKYWYDMWNTCINTDLGGRLAVEGKDILLENLAKKSDMIKAVRARSPDEAILLDDGTVPGDGCGAAGVDSAFFAHLKRNWNWGTPHASTQYYTKANERIKVEHQRNAYFSKVKPKPLRFTEFAGLKKVTGPATVQAVELRKKINQRQKNADERRAKQQKYQKLVTQQVPKQKAYVRRVLPRKRKLRPRVKYDEVDFCALQQMDKLRVDWESHEDNILLMCKVAMRYLFPNPRKQMVTFTAVRDTLREYSKQSYNKTSRACQRRLMYMCKRPRTLRSVALGVEEIKQNYYVNQRFGNAIEKMKKESRNTYEYEEKIADVFKELVAYIDKRFYKLGETETRDSFVLPKTIQEFNLLYEVKHPDREANGHGFSKDAKTTNDIHAATINSVIHSSMCCGKDRTAWAYQLFRVYQQYPESLLKSAMNKIRADRMVSMKKAFVCAPKNHGNCMPMSSSQYQLSSVYVYKFQTKWPYETFKESHRVIEKLARWHGDNQSEEFNYAVPTRVDGLEATPVTGGLVLAIDEYLTRGQMDFDVEIPDQIIMLDPRLKETDETYLRIAQRYQDILAGLEQLNVKRKQTVGSNLIDPEIEEEDEMERREFEDKIVKEKREKEDRDRWNYWKSRNDEIGRRLEEAEIKMQRQTEDEERRARRDTFDGQMVDRKKKYAQLLELGEENAPEAIVSEFRDDQEENKNDSDSEQEETDVVEDEDDDNHTIRFQDGTVIVLSNEDIDVFFSNNEDEDSSSVGSKRSKDATNSLATRKRKPVGGKSEYKSVASKRTKYEDPDLGEGKDGGEEPKEIDRSEEVKIDSISIAKREDDTENGRGKSTIDGETSSAKRSAIVVDEEVGRVGKKRRFEEETNEVAVAPTEEVEAKRADNRGESKDDKKTSLVPSGGTRLNDLLKKMYREAGEDQSGTKGDDSNDMQKRCTRIALLMMREELNDSNLTDSHHAHDYFVVNTFKVFYSLRLDGEKPRELIDYQDLRVPEEILPLGRERAKKMIEEVKKFAFFPKESTSFAEFRNHVESSRLVLAEELYKFVRDNKEMGATLKQISTKFQSTPSDQVYEMLRFLTDHRLFLRSGITNVRYVHQHYTDPWLIHSYKILRLDKEAFLPVPTGTTYALDGSTSLPQLIDDPKDKLSDTANEPFSMNTSENKDDERDQSRESTATDGEEFSQRNVVREDVSSRIKDPVALESTERKSDAATTEPEVIGDEKTSGSGVRRMLRKRTALVQPKEIQRAAKKLDINTAEEIKVVIKPWIRIDGVLNRRVLDRMLGAILTYCINHPSAFLSKVQRRFTPALQPFHTMELVEMLVQLECLDVKTVKKPKVTLFSKPSKVKLSDATGLDSEDELILEPAMDAGMKFAMFLGDRTYNVDFLT